METKAFNTLDVLGAATGRLMADIDGIYDVLNFATGESLFTHQLPRVSREFGAHLLRLRPDLSKAFEEAETVTRNNYQDIGARWIARYGDTILVHKLSEDEHERIDPSSEIAENFHPDNVIIVQTGGDT